MMAKEAQYNSITLPKILQSLRSYFKVLLKYWWVLLLCGLIGGLTGVFISSRQDPKYQARLSFALEESQSGGLSSAINIAAMLGIDLGNSGNIFSGDNIMAIMTSREIVERVLLTPDSSVAPLQSFANEWKSINKIHKGNKRLESISFPLNTPRSSFTYLQDSVLFGLYTGIVRNNLRVLRPDKKLNIYEVFFTCKDEKFAKEFTEQLVAETIDFYTELKSKRSLQTLQILEERVAAMKGATFSSIEKQSAVKDANVNPAFARANAELTKQQINATAYGEAYAELFKNLEIARMQYLKDIPLLQVIDKPYYPMLNLKWGRLKTGILFAFLFGAIAVFIIIMRHYIKRQEIADAV